MNRRNAIKLVSVSGALAAILAEGSIKNTLFTLLVTLATPATATGFVYTVSAMREAALQREAADKAHPGAKRTETQAEAGDEEQPLGAANPDADPAPDMPRRIDVMLNERTGFFSLLGDSAKVTPEVYRKTVRKMLRDDDLVFVSLMRHRKEDPDAYESRFGAKARKLKALHLRLLTLDPENTTAAAVAPTAEPTRISFATR